MTIPQFYRLSKNKTNRNVSEAPPCHLWDILVSLFFVRWLLGVLRDLSVSVKNNGRTWIFEGEQHRVGRGSRVYSNQAVPISFLQRFGAKRCMCSRWNPTETTTAASLIRFKRFAFWGCACHSHCSESQNEENCEWIISAVCIIRLFSGSSAVLPSLSSGTEPCMFPFTLSTAHQEPWQSYGLTCVANSTGPSSTDWWD